MCRSEAGNYDRVVIQDLLKEIAQTQQVDLSAKHRFKGVLLHCQTTVDNNLCVSLSTSCHYQRSRLVIKGCSSGVAEDYGKVHVEHANNTLCKHNKPTHCTDQE